MARMNLEDQFWLDVMDIINQVGDQDKAIGNAIRFLKFAQEKHKQGKLVSEEDFKAKGFSEALIPIFAKRTPSGIQANGADKHFAWLNQKIEAGRAGGKKSAQRKRDSKGRLLKKEDTSSKIHQAKPNGHQPSISISSSISSSNSTSQDSFAGVIENDDPPPRELVSPDGSSPTAITWRSYKAAYERRWGNAPPWNAKTAGQLKSFVARIPSQDAPTVAEFYLTHNDRYYVKAMHPVGLLLRDAEKLYTEWKTNRKVTDQEAKSAESGDHYREQMKRLGVTRG